MGWSAGPQLASVAPPAAPALAAFEGQGAEHDGRTLLLGPLSPRNAAALRPTGLATAGHVCAVWAAGGSLAPIFARQSICEMARTGRTPQQVMDDATWGSFREGWREGTGANADYLKTPADVEACLAAGFTLPASCGGRGCSG
jgi:hypothetical protein